MSWEIYDFISLVNDITGGNRKFQSTEYQTFGAFPIVDQSEKFISGFTNENAIVKRKKEVVLFGDHTKTLKFVDFDFCLGADGVKVLEPVNELDTKFLYYFLNTITLPDVGYSRHFKFLKELKIPLPPLATQKLIVEILDAADALRRQDQELIKKYDELSQAIFIKMFGDPVKNEMGWEQRNFFEIFEVTTGKKDSNASSKNGAYPFFTCSKDILRINSFSYDFECLLLAGNNAAGIYDIKHYNGKFDAYQRTYILRLKFEDDKYLFYKLLLEKYLEELQKSSIGSGTKYLTLEIFKRFNFISPPINLQHQFSEKMKLIDSLKFIISEQKNNSLFNSLVQKAFAGALVS